MKIKNLLTESFRQYEIDELIGDFRNNYIFYAENSLRGPSVFEEGLCYEFALGLYEFLKEQGEQPELIFLIGNMKKSEAIWYDSEEFDPTTEHPFHTIVKLRKFYYDINGRLGNKREIKAMWPKFRNKKVVPVSKNQVLKYVSKVDLVIIIKEYFEAQK